VAHRFNIEGRQHVHPKDNIQYALGDRHGGHANVKCYLLTSHTGESPVLSYQTKLSCMCHPS
jgi:hypothetical protein